MFANRIVHLFTFYATFSLLYLHAVADESTTDTTATTSASQLTTVELPAVPPSAQSSEEERRPTLQKIYTLNDRCAHDYCYNFHYNNPDVVAFFDLKAEVRINNDESTYDIISPRAYDALVFENSSFAHFPLHLFYSLIVKELDMRNCSIQYVTWECFLMAQNLRILLLSDNQLESLDEMCFKFASELQYLFLDSNRLKLLHPTTFHGLSQLRYLDLRHNQLTQLPAGIFDSLPALQELHLAENRLRIISNELFAYNPNLLILTLSTNRLARLEREALRAQSQLLLLDVAHNRALHALVMTLHTRNLAANNCSLTRVNVYGSARNVDLSYNRIKELYFTQPEALETLNLRNNSLEQLASLTRAQHLTTLDLGDNPRLGELPTPWRANSLVRFDLGNTGLRQLPIEALAEQTKLRYLNVSHNQLRDINPMNFKYLQALTHFEMNDNNWNCYNLNIMMDMLIKPHAMSYAPDRFDADFPGEYVNGIACMYRIEEPDQVATTQMETETVNVNVNENENVLPEKMFDQLGSSSTQSEQLQKEPAAEIQQLRQQLKAVVGFFEQKFDKTFEMMKELNARLAQFERMNASYWQHVTITV